MARSWPATQRSGASLTCHGCGRPASWWRVSRSTGRPYYVSEPPGPRLRLSYSASDAVRLSAGVEVLAQVLQARSAHG